MTTMFRLVLRTQLTRGRVVALGALGAVMVLLALAARLEEASPLTQAVADIVDGLGIGVIAPVVALVFASAALGDLAEDRTLVYLWLRPVPRWQLTVGAFAAAMLCALPFVVVPVLLAVLVAGAGAELIGAAVAACVLAVAGYGALFLGLGLRVRRALVWGLAYVLIWEGAVARAAEGAARLSVQVYARSLFAELADLAPPPRASSGVAAVIVLLAVAAAATAITARWLRTADVA